MATNTPYFKVDAPIHAKGRTEPSAFGSAGITADVIAEDTAAAGVTVDGVLLKDGGVTGALTMSDGDLMTIEGSGTGTGDVVTRYGATATEGLELRVYEETVTPAAVETNLLLLPGASMVASVSANCDAALTGGGTTVTWSIGTTADPDLFCTAGNGAGDTLLQNGKADVIDMSTFNGPAVQMALTGCVTGGATAGDTALTVGSVRVRVVYWAVNQLDDA